MLMIIDISTRGDNMRKPGGRAARRDWLHGYMFIWPSVVGLSVFVIYPAVTSLYYALTEWNGWDPPKWVGLQNFTDIFRHDPLTWVSFKATALYALVSIPASLLLGLWLAVLLNQKVPGIKIFRTIFYLPVVVPAIATAALWKFIYNQRAGLLNQLLALVHIQGPLWLGDPRTMVWALIIMGLWGVGSSMLIFLAGLQSVPEAIYEAAMVDGAGAVQRFWRITLPMITPIIFLQLVTGLINALQTFAQARVILSAGMGTPPGGQQNAALLWMINIYSSAFDYHHFGYAEAQVWLLFVVIAILTALIFRSQSRWVYYDNE